MAVAVKCDNCGPKDPNIGWVPSKANLSGLHIPRGWIAVFTDSGDPELYCSVSCLLSVFSQLPKPKAKLKILTTNEEDLDDE